MTPRLSVICVTYHSAEIVGDALLSAVHSARNAGLSVEVIVVDNASADHAAEAVRSAIPTARFIANGENLGFAFACNQAMSVARGDLCLFINPDATVDPDCVGMLSAFLNSNHKVAAVAPSIRSGRAAAESAGMHPSLRSAIGHFLFLNRLLPADMGGAWRGFQLQRRPALGPRRVDWASGAVLMLRMECLKAVGGLDAKYFLYGDDQDLCRRLRAAGWEVWLLGSARATHSIAGSQVGEVSVRWLEVIHDEYARSSGRLRTALFDLIVFIGLAARAIAAPKDENHTLHRRRMRAAANTAVRLMGLALTQQGEATQPTGMEKPPSRET